MNKSIFLLGAVLLASTVVIFAAIYNIQESNNLKMALAMNAFCEQYGQQITNSFNNSLVNNSLMNKLYNNESIKVFCFYSPECSNYGNALIKNVPSCMCNVLTKNKIIETNVCIKIAE